MVCPYRTRTSTFYISSMNLHIKMERKLSTCTLLFSKNGVFGNDYIKYKTIRQGWQIGMQFHNIFFIPPRTFYAIAMDNETIEIHHSDFIIHKVVCELKDSFHVSHVINGEPLYSAYVKVYSDSTFLKQKSLHLKTKENFNGLTVFDSMGNIQYSVDDGAFYKFN